MKISVCMAVYNGQDYICQQLMSILLQISNDDEVVIVDDASTDRSLDIIRAINDPRISIFTNSANLGVIASFERSLKLASGDLIFLSDQDDVWLPNKVENITQVFYDSSEITLVSSDAQLVDRDGSIIAESFFESRGAFTANPFLNLLKNKHHGCVLAFRKDVLNWVLPFPPDLPMHDIWIGIVNGIYGKSYYLDMPLIQHRRHGSNASRDLSNHAGLPQMLKWRYSLLKSVLKLLVRRELFKP
jgi:glycosyltransferase involved in cell wall biosynthesis